MSDLISRSAVIDYLRELAGLVIIEKNKKGFVNADVCNGMMCSIEAFRNFVLLVPSVDAVPVVRCKVCKRWGTKEVPGATDRVKLCEFGGYMVGENGYCVYGEKVEHERD